ncbi:MAG: hypothetical protein R2684_02625 [Pyrinomonadaceae bacterium]
MSRIRTEISIESSESFVVRRKRFAIRKHCGVCGRISIFVLPTEAGFLSGFDLDSIVSRVYEGMLHVEEIPERGIYICLSSVCRLDHAESDEDLDVVERLVDVKDREMIFLEGNDG